MDGGRLEGRLEGGLESEPEQLFQQEEMHHLQEVQQQEMQQIKQMQQQMEMMQQQMQQVQMLQMEQQLELPRGIGMAKAAGRIASRATTPPRVRPNTAAAAQGEEEQQQAEPEPEPAPQERVGRNMMALRNASRQVGMAAVAAHTWESAAHSPSRPPPPRARSASPKRQL